MTPTCLESSQPLLELAGVGMTYRGARHVEVLRNVDFRVFRGECVTIIGRSGVGKTTLLRIAAGLLAPTCGQVRIDGKQDGLVGRAVMVFQDFARSLLGWRTVLGNVALSLEARGLPRSQANAAAIDALQRVGLSDVANELPWRLSGGMQQRVALARALAAQPSILLLDEPFGSLDAPARQDLEDHLLTLWSSLGLTVVLTTHDLDEATYLGQRVALLDRNLQRISLLQTVELGYPRNQLSTREHPEFLRLRRILHMALNQEATP